MLAVALAAMWVWQWSSRETAYPPVEYSQAYDWIASGAVASVILKGQALTGKLRGSETVRGQQVVSFQTVLPREDPALLPLLREKKVEIRVATEEQPFAIQLLLGLAPWLLVIGAWVWLSRRAGKMMASGGPLGGILKPRSRRFEREAARRVTSDDVAGLKSAKQDLGEIVQFLGEPERFRRLGGKVPRGVLLVGPPGTGKTLLARAVAGESGVPFFSISASEFIELFVGVGAARVRDLFAEAKKSQPAIVFIDEIDAVGRARGAGLGGGHDEREQTLNQLLSEMDGFSRSDLTVVIAATNRPDVLDPALLRPGRFDRRVVVDRPELAARRAILAVHTRDKPLAPEVDLDALARSTPGFSGADLANLANEAALGATRRGASAIGPGDFATALDKIVLGDPREARLDPPERHRVAVHESGHAVVAHFTAQAEPLRRVSIIPRGMALGVTQQTPAGDRYLMTQPQLEARLRVLMGGYSAERSVLGSISSGAESDLKQATEIASRMVARFGMSERLGPVYCEHQAEHPFLGQRIATEGATSDATTQAIEAEARALLGRALEDASRLIEEMRPALDRLVQGLLETETVERDELQTLLGARPGGGASPVAAAR
ncbi:MAG TPA: ATP-dependent zinc metalloprotease FtsH [Anaeromyxobacteraceae bacterium]|nr:ATP-dependent zinc metalloprotease FtsH [Anaeromyxobacteraceae bacterium]